MMSAVHAPMKRSLSIIRLKCYLQEPDGFRLHFYHQGDEEIHALLGRVGDSTVCWVHELS